MGNKSFCNLLDELEEQDIVGFQHKGEWAIFEAMEELVERTKPAIVKIETFNISEDFVRPMFFTYGEKKISEIKMVIDMNVKRHKLPILLFASNVTDQIHIAPCHAKVLLVKNDKEQFGIVGSANANQPARYESGIIFRNERLFRFFENAFDTLFNESIPFACS